MRRSMPWCGAAGWLLCLQMGAAVVVSTAAALLEVKLNNKVNLVLRSQELLPEVPRAWACTFAECELRH